MEKTAVIIGAGDATGIRVARDLRRMGWRVFPVYLDNQPAEKECPIVGPRDQKSMLDAARDIDTPIDMLIVNIDVIEGNENATILDRLDLPALMACYDCNSVGPLRAINAFSALLERGAGKRVCVITSKDSSNNLCRDTDRYCAHITKAPLNMAMNMMHNGMRPDGYTFRLYCKDTAADDDKIGEYAAQYFTRNRSDEPYNRKHSDEDRMVMRDWMEIELPW